MIEKNKISFLRLSWMRTRDKIIAFVIVWVFIALWYSFPIQRWLYFQGYTRSFVESRIPQENRDVAFNRYEYYHREAKFSEEVTGIRLCERSQTCDNGMEVTWERNAIVFWQIVKFTEGGGMGGFSRHKDYFEPGAPTHEIQPPWYHREQPLATYPNPMNDQLEIKIQSSEYTFSACVFLHYSDSVAINQHIEEELVQRRSEIDEHILKLVKNVNIRALATTWQEQDIIREQIKSEVNRMLRHGHIADVSFTGIRYIGAYQR